jgi:hypothetical protein
MRSCRQGNHFAMLIQEMTKIDYPGISHITLRHGADILSANLVSLRLDFLLLKPWPVPWADR